MFLLKGEGQDGDGAAKPIEWAGDPFEYRAQYCKEYGFMANIDLTKLRSSNQADVMGKRVEHVFGGILRNGPQRLEVGNALEAGIYFVRMQVNGQDKVLKILKTD